MYWESGTVHTKTVMLCVQLWATLTFRPLMAADMTSWACALTIWFRLQISILLLTALGKYSDFSVCEFKDCLCVVGWLVSLVSPLEDDF